MTTGCMRSTLEPEHRLMTQESGPYGLLVDRKSGMEEEALCAENQDLMKKPRRKDTPVLNSPPHIPGARVLKAGNQTVHLEDEEKDAKD
ncbi:protein phosphatase 1 regulatory subunit 17 [Notolabrus celidotus]|uniref:protein phosphatase 1 regulatory subunit 17 n=1 Tax=Notolabrus celidotus TaxID=1203425 RepID=UPI00148F6E9E|nr:protein phosphatase 1 regulatory subunit 17 [Notolabrus celidotus]XP_034561803.1 protein phosphatase 1 regulatory subunit 17 [Notolabrus celidotus]